jgi:hypothetical protein
MWIIYSLETGGEVETTEHYDVALNLVKVLNDNEYGFEYAKRWEEFR